MATSPIVSRAHPVNLHALAEYGVAQRNAVVGFLLGTAHAIARLFPFILVTAIVVEGVILYRLWTQVTGTTPASFYETWAYNISGPLIEPFREFDTASPGAAAPVVDMAALVALEVYLVATIAAVCVTAFAGMIARNEPGISYWHIILTPVRLPPQLALAGLGYILRWFGRGVRSVTLPVYRYVRSCSRRLDANLEAQGRRLDAYLKSFGPPIDARLNALSLGGYRYATTRDWDGYRRKVIVIWHAADDLTRQLVIKVAGPDAREAYRTAGLAIHAQLASISGAGIGFLSQKVGASARAGARRTARFRRAEHPAEQELEAGETSTARTISRRRFLHLP